MRALRPVRGVAAFWVVPGGWLGQHQRPTEQATTQPTIEMGARPYEPGLGRFPAVQLTRFNGRSTGLARPYPLDTLDRSTQPRAMYWLVAHGGTILAIPHRFLLDVYDGLFRMGGPCQEALPGVRILGTVDFPCLGCKGIGGWAHCAARFHTRGSGDTGYLAECKLNCGGLLLAILAPWRGISRVLPGAAAGGAGLTGLARIAVNAHSEAPGILCSLFRSCGSP